MGGQGLLNLAAAVGGFALECFVQRLPEGIPQFLRQLAVHRHSLRFELPTLLQSLHCVNAQTGRSAQLFGFFNHGAAQRHAVSLGFVDGCVGGLHRGLPLRLHVGKEFFTQVTTVAPALGEGVQFTRLFFPIGVARVFLRPSSHLGQQGHALFTVGRGLGLGFFKPSLHKGIGPVACLIKTLPQTVVGLPALVGFFPGLAQLAQAVLQLATGDDGLPFGDFLAFHHGFAFGLDRFHQGFGFGHQLGAHRIGLLFLQRGGGFAGGLRFLGFGLHRRVCDRLGCSHRAGFTTQHTQLVGPSGHRRQRQAGVLRGRLGLRQGR